MKSAARKKRRWAPAAAAACLVLAIAGGGAGWYVQTHTVASVVSLDVNPSVILDVSRQESVLSATPMNEDGVDILDGMDLRGVKLDVAMNAIVGSLLKNGYVDELANSILITVEAAMRSGGKAAAGTDRPDRRHPGQHISKWRHLSQTIQSSSQIQQLADEYGISAGKAALIQTIVEQSNGLHTFEELVGLSINDLNLIYTSRNTSAPDGTGGESSPAAPGIQSSGQASDSAYIGVEAAQQAAFAHAGVDGRQGGRERGGSFDYEDGRMVYED